MSIRLVVFDMAGTTVHDDGVVNDCLRQVLQEAGVVVDRAAVNAVMGEPKPVAIAKLLNEHPRPDSDEVRRLYARFESVMVSHYAASPNVRPVEGAEETFRALKAHGISVALDTGFNRTVVDAILRRLDWWGASFIDATVASDEVERGRPHPDLIRRAMRLTGIAHDSDVAKVGDTPSDLLEVTAAGCSKVIGITSGSHGRSSLEQYPHTDLVDSLQEVPPLCI